MVIVIDCHLLPCSKLIPTFWGRMVSSNPRNMEQSWKLCEDSSHLMYQLNLKIKSGFSMTERGNTPCTGETNMSVSLPCQTGQDASQIHLHTVRATSLVTSRTEHSRKIHSFSTLTGTECNCFIFYHPQLKTFFFVSFLFGLIFEFSFFNWSDCWLILMLCPTFCFNFSLEFVPRIFFPDPCKLALGEVKPHLRVSWSKNSRM